MRRLAMPTQARETEINGMAAERDGMELPGAQTELVAFEPVGCTGKVKKLGGSGDP